MMLEYDRQADAAYVRVTDRPVACSRELDEQRIVDYDDRGEIVGFEFLTVSLGVELNGLPYRPALERLLAQHDIRQLA
jgi:uncharacterized protein YuzE